MLTHINLFPCPPRASANFSSPAKRRYCPPSSSGRSCTTKLLPFIRTVESSHFASLMPTFHYRDQKVLLQVTQPWVTFTTCTTQKSRSKLVTSRAQLSASRSELTFAVSLYSNRRWTCGIPLFLTNVSVGGRGFQRPFSFGSAQHRQGEPSSSFSRSSGTRCNRREWS